MQSARRCTGLHLSLWGRGRREAVGEGALVSCRLFAKKNVPAGRQRLLEYLARLAAPTFLALLLLVSPAQAEGPLLSGDFVLALSWQPAFCEMRPRTPECASQTKGRFDAGNFSLHGLWPEPQGNIYCDVSPALRHRDERGDWYAVPGLQLSPEIAMELRKLMPGTQSGLERHEWIKHGTCSGGTPAEYYAASIALVNAVNASPLRDLFADNIGSKLSANVIRRAFDQAFGRGAGQRVLVACNRDGGRMLIGELRIALSGEISEDLDLRALLAAAPTQPRGCPAGEVDPAGQQ